MWLRSPFVLAATLSLALAVGVCAEEGSPAVGLPPSEAPVDSPAAAPSPPVQRPPARVVPEEERDATDEEYDLRRDNPASRRSEYDAAVEDGDYGRAMQGSLQDMYDAETEEEYDQALDRFNDAGQLDADSVRDDLDELIER
jgi:hypothetical protein